MKILAATLTLLLAVSSSAFAADYPSKPIRVIVPFGAGTGTDVAVRLVLDQLTTDTGAVVVVENVPGANSLIGIKRGLAAAPDGYTLMATGTTINSIGSALFKEATYDPIKDFTQIAVVAVYPTLLAVSGKSSYKTLADLVNASKGKPGKLSIAYASSSMQIKGAAFQKNASVTMTGVPYKTSTEALKDLVGGETDCMVVDVATALSLTRGGQVRAVAVLGDQRSRLLPDVPTIGETGQPKLTLDSWSGIGASSRIPADAKAWLIKNVNAALANPAVAEKLAGVGSQPLPNVALNPWVESQLGAWRQSTKDSGIEPQ